MEKQLHKFDISTLKYYMEVVVFTLPMQSVPITTKMERLNLAQARCTRYNIM